MCTTNQFQWKLIFQLSSTSLSSPLKCKYVFHIESLTEVLQLIEKIYAILVTQMSRAAVFYFRISRFSLPRGNIISSVITSFLVRRGEAEVSLMQHAARTCYGTMLWGRRDRFAAIKRPIPGSGWLGPTQCVCRNRSGSSRAEPSRAQTPRDFDAIDGKWFTGRHRAERTLLAFRERVITPRQIKWSVLWGS